MPIPQTHQKGEIMSGLLNSAPLHYPSARDWMWDYCIYLGPYTNSVGQNYDLGIFIQTHSKEVSHAIVFGNEPGDYMSGDIKSFQRQDVHKENIRRATECGLYKE